MGGWRRPWPDGGATIGQRGSEDGVIVRDDEHEAGARITLERDCTHAPLTITLGIYGWMCHTRFFGVEPEAEAEFTRMQDGLAAILELVPPAEDPEAEAKGRRVADAISDFVERFP